MVRALTLTALSLSLRAPCCCTRWRAREKVECEDARRDVYYRAAPSSSSLGKLELLALQCWCWLRRIPLDSVGGRRDVCRSAASSIVPGRVFFFLAA